MLYLALAVIFLHLSVIPLTVKTEVLIDGDECGKLKAKLFFIPVFVKRIDVDRIKRILRGEAEPETQESGKKETHGGFKSAVKAFLIKVGLEIAKRVRVREMNLTAKIGVGDAAATAFAVGTAGILYCQLCAFLSANASTGRILPDYDAETLFLEFSGIFSLCFADIIYALCAVCLSKFTAQRDKRRKYEHGIAR